MWKNSGAEADNNWGRHASRQKDAHTVHYSMLIITHFAKISLIGLDGYAIDGMDGEPIVMLRLLDSGYLTQDSGFPFNTHTHSKTN